MSIFGDLVIAVGSILNTVLSIYTYVIVISALISWVNPDPYNQIVRFLYSVTEPVLRPVRRFIGYRLGPIDISPIVVIVAIIIIQSTLIKQIIKFGYMLGGG